MSTSSHVVPARRHQNAELVSKVHTAVEQGAGPMQAADFFADDAALKRLISAMCDCITTDSGFVQQGLMEDAAPLDRSPRMLRQARGSATQRPQQREQQHFSGRGRGRGYKGRGSGRRFGGRLSRQRWHVQQAYTPPVTRYFLDVAPQVWTLSTCCMFFSQS
jgi:hypothetical protein